MFQSKENIKELKMGLKRFRAQMSIEQKLAKLSTTPEFYRKIPQTDSLVAKSQKNIDDNVRKPINANVKQLNELFD